MAHTSLLRPTLHVEVQLKSRVNVEICQVLTNDIRDCLTNNYTYVQVNMRIHGYEDTQYAALVDACYIVDFTGPKSETDIFFVEEAQLDIQIYSLRTGHESGGPRRRISQPGGADDDMPQARVLALPNLALTGEWDSLIYDDELPARLLRYLTRMLGVMKQADLNLSMFNWNRLVLLHGPPGSGKSTLCRALAQKLSIRLSATFPQAVLVEVNTSAMLSKYFGESGKLIGNLFEKIHGLAHSPTTLVCVVIDEVETVAGSRQKATDGGECSDGLRATNQLLTALDKLRALPNIIVLCTSNLISAMDAAFLDRVDIKELIPSPPPAAIYNIFRSCLNELVRTQVIESCVEEMPTTSPADTHHPPPSSPSVPTKRQAPNQRRQSSSPELLSKKTGSRTSPRTSPLTVGKSLSSANKSPLPEKPIKTEIIMSPLAKVEQPSIPTYLQLRFMYLDKPQSFGGRVWALAEKCVGFSGRTLRRLPILGLAMHTWGGECSLHDAISALESAVDQEIKAKSE